MDDRGHIHRMTEEFAEEERKKGKKVTMLSDVEMDELVNVNTEDRVERLKQIRKTNSPFGKNYFAKDKLELELDTVNQKIKEYDSKLSTK